LQWGGGISTLFAYGQTGSGKTFTLDALERRAAKDLFGGLEGNRDVYISIFDLAGNVASGKPPFTISKLSPNIHPDLLNDRRKISVLQDSFGETQLVGAIEPKVTSVNELIELIERSMKFRKSAPTLRNDSSSRTHAVCRIRIVNKDVSETPDGLLFLIDLAGSEAATDMKDHSADRMKESREINTSLSTLKDCIRGRTMWYMDQAQVESGGKSKPIHIPYRNSTLTKVLKHVFDTKGYRHCKTAVVACVSPNIVDVGPTKNSFRYAEMLRIPVPPFKQPVHKESMPSTWTSAALKTWIDNNVSRTLTVFHQNRARAKLMKSSPATHPLIPLFSPQPRMVFRSAASQKASSYLGVSKLLESQNSKLVRSTTNCGVYTSILGKRSTVQPLNQRER